MTSVDFCLNGGSLRRLVVALLFSLAVFPVAAEELKIEAKLLWATNDDTSPNPKHKKVDEEFAKKLRNIPFKWKNYFEENCVTGVIPSRQSRVFKMSSHCTIEITELEGPKVEVKLIGEGKPVNKTIKSLSRGEFFTIGGDSKNGSAWLVIVTQTN